eukprot:gene10457-biopygen2990
MSRGGCLESKLSIPREAHDMSHLQMVHVNCDTWCFLAVVYVQEGLLRGGLVEHTPPPPSPPPPQLRRTSAPSSVMKSLIAFDFVPLGWGEGSVGEPPLVLPRRR